ncbi:hypothetical protein CC85DRAFT_302138 [Cutaneotrichosporon oleaginosum]|uniref:Uncharacterized protein n=1 Tax=Cutaneotrichosporon oleaginosum TaxID=879819 RepID=A0A0J0XNA0_9TREE|nr:uncharacterized protein CC85DRAFT_302138 [Cutaneotrichosporon oleaginosum]KLT42616.1 hypothetical protein CC85DRAFT_302138 [Cutaneotrichosporon oleaginosum]TXT05267.1 hypothetical protein COLE_06587 [Cutaneotrichosporon oleaginosum]
MNEPVMTRREQAKIPPTNVPDLIQYKARRATHHMHAADEHFSAAWRLGIHYDSFEMDPSVPYFKLRCRGWRRLMRARTHVREAQRLLALLSLGQGGGGGLLDTSTPPMSTLKREYLFRRIAMLDEMLSEQFDIGNRRLQRSQGMNIEFRMA